ncbi:hypothetical protein GCM10009546_02820 [Actinomadura livida]|uniref:Uncharacterized protein n=1 Tax=Actinomadura livida TaxID=79909 RepID=A0ABP3NJQ1_9ACTN
MGFWPPVVFNLTLLAAISLPHTVPETTEHVVAGHAPPCAPIGPVASRYVDRNKVCRRARKEVLRSLRTGRDPDWNDVFRDYIPRVSKPPSRRPKPSDPSHKPRKHRESAPPTPAPSHQGRQTAPTRSSTPSPGQVESSAQPPPPTPREHDTPIPTAPAKQSSHKTGPFGWVGVAALLALTAGVAYVAGRRRRAFCQATRSMLRRLNRQANGVVRATPVTPTERPASEERGAQLSSKVVSLVGPGAEGAVRRLALDALTDRKGRASELVIARPDAWRLFGIDIGTLQEEKIPGLTLTEDAQQTRTYPGTQRPLPRILITCDDGSEAVRELPPRGQSQLTVLSLSPSTEVSTEVSADGVLTPHRAAPPLPDRLPLLSRPDAFNRLMSMPTISRRRETQV